MQRPFSPISPIILTGLNSPWEAVQHLGVPAQFTASQVIAQNDRSGFYYLKRGRVRLSYIAPNGQERVLFYLGRGTLFLDAPVLVQSLCIFTCMEAGEAIFFKKSLISESFVVQHPALMLNWVESVARKSSNFYKQLCGIGLHDTFVNVCRVLYSMVLYQKEQGKIVPYLTQLEVASLLGVHRGSLHKAFVRLRQEGVIGDYSRQILEVFDEERLRSYAEDA